MGEIDFHREKVDVPGFDPEFLRLWINYIINELNKKVGAISYIFCSDEYILNINKQYLNHDYFTDIITFNYNDGEVVSGDVFISVDTVASNAIEFSNGDTVAELERVIIHGVLHLCGFNDKSEADQAEMTEMENWALKEMLRFT